MKNLSTEKSRDIIKGKPLNREAIYYSALFGAAFVFSLVLLLYGNVKSNSGLITYSAILVPVFATAALASLIFAIRSNNIIYVEDEVLVINRFLSTRKIPLADIGRVSVATNNKTGITSINVNYNGKTAHYNYKNFTKEEIAHLRRATSKY